MGTRGIGRFSRSEKRGDNFTASEGEDFEGVTIESLDRKRAVLRLGQATFELTLKPEEMKPTPAVRVRPRQRRQPVRPDRQPTKPEDKEPADLSKQETPFQQ